MNPPIPQHLLEKALTLTGKTMDPKTNFLYDFELESKNPVSGKWYFSIEKFCYYLNSPSFIEKYCREVKYSKSYILERFATIVHEYQSGNSQPLISLLEKI